MDADGRPVELDPKTRKRIWRKAMQLSRQDGFQVSEWPDLEQELILHVHEQLPKYDPRRGEREHFLATVIRRKATDMGRIRRAQRRGAQFQVRSIHEVVPGHEGDSLRVEDLAGESAVLAQAGLGGGLTEEQVQCRVDVARVEATLTARQREICRLLRTASITEAALALNMPRSSLYQEIEAIREVFRRAGIHEYLR